MKSIKKIYLLYPPGPIYQRGEDRSQGNVDYSTATSMRAPNDMSYISAQIKKENLEVLFKDYASEKLDLNVMKNDFKNYNPDVVLISTTNSTVDHDIEILNNFKKINPNIICILKGSIFFKAPLDLTKILNLKLIDFLIGGEIEFSFIKIINEINNGTNNFDSINGIYFKKENIWQSTNFENWDQEIDELTFPDRSIIKNSLYVRPDTGEPQATISTSRGCPASCIYCLTPTISGKQVRFRSSESILKEMLDCYNNHGIKNFFFKSDTFTIDKNWVKDLCNKINNSELKNKIEWVANSRVRPLEYETLKIMKDAGCWLIAFGFESGSSETLKKIKKGATIEDNLKAAELTRKAGLKLYGFYLIGLPWENKDHLEMTEKHIFDTNPDFLELHIAVPYYGTELYSLSKKEGLIKTPIIGQNYFEEASTGTKYLSSQNLINFRRKVIAKYHLRPKYILSKIKDAKFNYNIIKNYTKYGARLIHNLLK